jgi:hypothetical protein
MEQAESALWIRPVAFWMKLPKLLVCMHEHVRKHAFEASLFVVVMEHYHRNDPQGMPARTAGSHFTLQILQKPVSKVILIACSPRRLHAMLPAIGTVVFQSIFLRIPTQSSPAGVSNANSFS